MLEKIHLERQFCPSPRLDQAPLTLFCLCTCDLYFPGCTIPPFQLVSGTVSHSSLSSVYFVWQLWRQTCGFAYFWAWWGDWSNSVMPCMRGLTTVPEKRALPFSKVLWNESGTTAVHAKHAYWLHLTRGLKEKALPLGRGKVSSSPVFCSYIHWRSYFGIY